jgi:hypothetical protein
VSGHGSSRRRNYGKRQKDLRDRHATDLSVDLDGPSVWPRGGAWDRPTHPMPMRTDVDRSRQGGAA